MRIIKSGRIFGGKTGPRNGAGLLYMPFELDSSLCDPDFNMSKISTSRKNTENDQDTSIARISFFWRPTVVKNSHGYRRRVTRSDLAEYFESEKGGQGALVDFQKYFIDSVDTSSEGRKERVIYEKTNHHTCIIADFDKLPQGLLKWLKNSYPILNEKDLEKLGWEIFFHCIQELYSDKSIVLRSMSGKAKIFFLLRQSHPPSIDDKKRALYTLLDNRSLFSLCDLTSPALSTSFFNRSMLESWISQKKTLFCHGELDHLASRAPGKIEIRSSKDPESVHSVLPNLKEDALEYLALANKIRSSSVSDESFHVSMPLLPENLRNTKLEVNMSRIFLGELPCQFSRREKNQEMVIRHILYLFRQHEERCINQKQVAETMKTNLRMVNHAIQKMKTLGWISEVLSETGVSYQSGKQSKTYLLSKEIGNRLSVVWDRLEVSRERGPKPGEYHQYGKRLLFRTRSYAEYEEEVRKLPGIEENNRLTQLLKIGQWWLKQSRCRWKEKVFALDNLFD
jgi:hypothetical protein